MEGTGRPPGEGTLSGGLSDRLESAMRSGREGRRVLACAKVLRPV